MRQHRRLVLHKITSLMFLFLLVLSMLPLSTPIVSGALSYYQTNWDYYKTVTIDHTKVEVNMPNFPMLFKNTSYSFRQYAQLDGDDFVFTDDTGTKLSHEIESYDYLTGTLIAWVNVPLISSTVDTVVYLYYGNASAVNQEDVSNVWDANYVGVWHMGETSGEVVDSVAYRNFTTYTATSATTSDSIGYCRYFDAQADALKTTYAFPVMSTYTMECWMNYSKAAGGTGDVIFAIPANSPSLLRYTDERFLIYAAGGYIGTSVNAYADVNWHYITYGNNGSNMSLRIDTVKENDTVGAYDTANNVFCVGDNNVGTDSFYGYVDEVRLSDISRNWSYHNATYNSITSPDTFYSVSSHTSASIFLYTTANGSHIDTTWMRMGGAPQTAYWDSLHEDTSNCVSGSYGGAPAVSPFSTMVFSDISGLSTDASILNVTVRGTWAKDVGVTGTCNYTVFTHGTYYNGTSFTVAPTGVGITALFTNRGLYNTTWSTNPYTGLAWTVSEINDAEFGIRINTTVQSYCFYLYAEVFYEIQPMSLTSSNVNATQVSLSWVKSSWGNTVVVGKLGSTPTTWTDGTSLYNGSASTAIVIGLSPSKHYYFKAWAFNTTRSTYSEGNTSDDCWTRPERITSSAYANTKVGAANYIEVTWVNSTWLSHTRTVIRKSFTSQPVLPTDGTEAYNGTGTPYFNETFSLAYYTIFHYNGSITSTDKFSVGSNVLSYVFLLNCYNESSGLALTNWNVLVSNASGTQIYQANNCNNSKIVSVGLIPSGVGCTITFSRDNYTTRAYTKTIVKNGVFNISGYLAPFTEDTEPPTNTSYLYLITVINEAGQTVDDAYIRISRVINGSFHNVTTGYTDGNGQFSTYLQLVPYKIYVSKVGYVTQVSDWIPSNTVFTYTIKIYVNATTPSDYLWYEQHTFTAEMLNASGHVYVNFSNLYDSLTDWQVYIYRVCDNGSSILYGTFTGTNETFSVLYMGTNNTFDYRILIWVNHSYFGRVLDETSVYGYHSRPHGKSAKFNLLMSANFGWNPLGWANTVGLFIIIGVMFSFGRRETYMSMLLLGVLLIFLDVYIGFPTVWNTLASGMFCVIIIFLGILMLVRDRGMYGSS